jgi:hypothetical protein
MPMAVTSIIITDPNKIMFEGCKRHLREGTCPPLQIDKNSFVREAYFRGLLNDMFSIEII